MKRHASILRFLATVILIPLVALAQQGKGGGNRSGSVPQGGVLRSGPLPDLKAFTAEGKPLRLRELCKGSYTVLSAGCLPCPEFRRGYPEILSSWF